MSLKPLSMRAPAQPERDYVRRTSRSNNRNPSRHGNVSAPLHNDACCGWALPQPRSVPASASI